MSDTPIPTHFLSSFAAFAIDHIKHFNAVPCEFEADDGTVYDMGSCWEAAVSLGLTKRLNDDA
jgi:hypothetical protein